MIVVNKNFNNKYLYRAFETFLVGDYDISTYYAYRRWYGYYSYSNYKNWYTEDYTLYASVFNDLSSYDTEEWAGMNYGYSTPSSYLLVNESMIKLINLINKKYKSPSDLPLIPSNGNITTDMTGETIPELKYVVNTLFGTVDEYRNGIIDFFVKQGDITEDEATSIKLSTKSLLKFDIHDTLGLGKNGMIKRADFDVFHTDSTVQISTNIRLKLLDGFKMAENNPTGENLYMLIIPFSDSKFIDGNTSDTLGIVDGDETGTNLVYPTNDASYIFEGGDSKYHFGYQTFHKKDTDSTVEQIPYLALKITEIGQGGDLQFDHIDDIEYFDEFSVKINIPKAYS